MSDLISRQAAIDAMSETLKIVFPEHRQIAEKCLNALPFAQPEIIRCKDCKYHGINECFHKLGMIASMDDGFCSYAERRTDVKADKGASR